MPDWDDSDPSGQHEQHERRVGVNSLWRLENSANVKLDRLSDDMLLLKGRLREVSRDVRRLEKVVYGFCILIVVAFFGALLRNFIH